MEHGLMETKMTVKDWPILLISGQWKSGNDDSYILSDLVKELETTQGCTVIGSHSYSDAAEIISSRNDLGCVIIDWDLNSEGVQTKMTAADLVNLIRYRNRTLPIILLTDKLQLQNIPTEVLAKIDETIWKTDDTPDFLAGRIEQHVHDYAKNEYGVFFGPLVKYAEKYKYAWHTPGHLGGQGFLRSPSGVAFYKYFGENVFRSDLSISVPELGELNTHDGVTGAAERNSAKVFGADYCFYVLNGTSTVNQIIWRSQVWQENSLVDRNCHKSLNYGMINSDARPVYMKPRRNAWGIIGPVPISEFDKASVQAKLDASGIVPADKKNSPVKMAALTNSTYDGVIYNTDVVKEHLGKVVENIHFDEAWYAYAKFHPMYAHHYAMTPGPAKEGDPAIFASQSTHKLLTAFSQCSMLLAKDGYTNKLSMDRLNESYMMHTSTSPQYNMVAALDVATQMMSDNGQVMLSDVIYEACQIRQKIASMHLDAEAKGDWFFDMWQPRKVKVDGKTVKFEEAPLDYLATHQEPWIMNNEDPWHGFKDLEENYVMLDPIKLTVSCPGIKRDGTFDKNIGIPGSIVSNYLINHNIVNEKTDYYSLLFLNSFGTTRAKQGTLVAALLKFKEDFDKNTPLEELFPDLVAAHPCYKGKGLRDHCLEMHQYIMEHKLLQLLDQAFEVIPDQVLTPADAYHEVVRRNVEYVWWDEMSGRVPAVMTVPYPPGIPILMEGEILNDRAKPIYDYMIARQDFERVFPGYEAEIHGVERGIKDGKVCFKTLCVKKDVLNK